MPPSYTAGWPPLMSLPDPTFALYRAEHKNSDTLPELNTLIFETKPRYLWVRRPSLRFLARTAELIRRRVERSRGRRTCSVCCLHVAPPPPPSNNADAGKSCFAVQSGGNFVGLLHRTILIFCGTGRCPAIMPLFYTLREYGLAMKYCRSVDYFSQKL